MVLLVAPVHYAIKQVAAEVAVYNPLPVATVQAASLVAVVQAVLMVARLQMVQQAQAWYILTITQLYRETVIQ
jgi:hypothetical protein